MEKLISMVNYILHKDRFKEDSNTAVFQITNYANFLSQSLRLEMFVPCNKEGNVLKEPTNLEKMQASWADNPIDDVFYKVRDFNKAKEKVLFEGFNYIKELRNSGGNYTHILKKDDFEIYIQWGGFHISGKKEIKTIEDLVPYNLTLTKNAIDKHEL